jgi:hypothetical protein
MNPIEIVDAEVNPKFVRNSRQVKERVRRAANRSVNDDRVLERIARENVAWSQVLLHKLQNLFSGSTRVTQEHREWRWDQRGAWQREPKRLG